jgi:hypothetical protein
LHTYLGLRNFKIIVPHLKFKSAYFEKILENVAINITREDITRKDVAGEDVAGEVFP